MKDPINIQTTETIRFEQIVQLVEPCLQDLESRLIELLHSDRPLIKETSRYLLQGGGKRFRPICVLLFSGLTGGINSASSTLSCCMELCHTATLIHDDIIDHAETRRGLDSINAHWGNQIAVLAGDYLYTKATALAADLNDLDIIQLMAHSVSRIVEGEMMELGIDLDSPSLEDDYIQVIRYKTAELISVSCQLGVMVNTRNLDFRKAAQDYGILTGLAFQIIDDTLDYTADRQIIGKPIHQDLLDGKLTLPLLHLRKLLSKPDRSKLDNILMNHPTEEEIHWVLEHLQDSGSIAYSQNYAQKLITQADQLLTVFPPSAYTEALQSLGQYILIRSS